MREITREDKVGFPGYQTKSNDDCPFIQRKTTVTDIWGHDSYESYCTKDWDLKLVVECIHCKKCKEYI